jgi:hypothetical protein
MTELELTSIVDLSEEEMDEYLSICLSAKDVSPADKKKLSGLLKHYAKMKHPFTACVRDNTKRFGRERAERICAVLKDIIRGTTKWRSTERKKNLSESTLNELFQVDIDDAFVHYLSELEVDEFGQIAEYDESSDEQLLAEMFFDGGDVSEEGGLVWKTVLREGTWQVSPGPGQRPTNKPIVVTADGASDARNQVISMAELKENFDAGVVEHVTVPLTHEDRVDENTGFVKAMKIEDDEEGRKVLKAGIEFTEPEIKQKALRGTIANISGGVLFDYIQKETGKLFKGVMAHAALTNHPWLNGLKPFGVEASENLQVVAFSEVTETDSAQAGGGETVSTTETETTTPVEFDFQAAFGMSEEELKASLADAEAARARNAELEKEARETRIDGQIDAWQKEGKVPALLAEAKAILTVSDGKPSGVMLSEDGKDTELSVDDIVTRLVNAAPSVKLSEEQVTEEGASKDAPKTDTTDENDQADLSLSEKEEVVHLTLYGNMTEEAAIAEVRAKRETA